MRMCLGTCARHAVPKRFGAMYSLGFGYCRTCSTWFGLDRVNCPCCSMPLRRSARANRGGGGSLGRRSTGRVPMPLPPAAHQTKPQRGAT